MSIVFSVQALGTPIFQCFQVPKNYQILFRPKNVMIWDLFSANKKWTAGPKSDHFGSDFFWVDRLIRKKSTKIPMGFSEPWFSPSPGKRVRFRRSHLIPYHIVRHMCVCVYIYIYRYIYRRIYIYISHSCPCILSHSIETVW